MGVAVSVAPSSAVTVSVLMEETESQEVDDQTHDAHVQDHLGVVDVLGLVEALQGLHRDGEAQGHQEHSVH